MQDIPQSLVGAIESKEVVLFVGSGLSVAAGLPSANALAIALTKKLSPSEWSGLQNAPPLQDVAEKYFAKFGQNSLAVEVKKYIRTTGIGDLSSAHFLIASLVKHRFIDTIVTTNYDTLLEDACRAVGVDLEVVVTDSQLALASAKTPKLLKMHGDFNHPELLVLTRNDYATFLTTSGRARLIAHLRDLAGRRPFFFIGYSLQDGNFLQLLAGIRTEATRFDPRSHAAVYNVAEIDLYRQEMAQYGVAAFAASAIDRVLYDILDRLPISLLVAHLVFSYPDWYPHPRVQFGGIETFLMFLKHQSQSDRGLSKHRHEVFSVYDRALLDSTPADEFLARDLLYPASFFFFRSAVTGALQEILARRGGEGKPLPDVIHSHFLAFAELAVDAGFPTVCTSHSLLSVDLAYARGLFDGIESEGAVTELRELRRAEQHACQFLDTVTTVSEAHKNELDQLGGSGISVLMAPFDPTPFEQMRATSPAKARRNLTPPIEEMFTISFLGRPDRRKGVELLFDACTTLLKERRSFQLLLVGGFGGNEWDPHLTFGLGKFRIDTSVFKDLGGRYHQRYAHGSREVALHMAAADIIVVPSLYEPMGYVVLEGMASGRPVVAAKVGGIPEMIRHRENGLLFPQGDADKLAAAIRLLMEDPALAQRLAANAAGYIAQRESPAKSVARYDALYQRAALARGQPARHHFSDAIIASVDKLCEQYAAYRGSNVYTVHATAAVGCKIVKELRSLHPEYVPPVAAVDGKLLQLVADRLHQALRRTAKVISFPPLYLTKMMADLALSYLNAERERDTITLTRTENGTPDEESSLADGRHRIAAGHHAVTGVAPPPGPLPTNPGRAPPRPAPAAVPAPALSPQPRCIARPGRAPPACHRTRAAADPGRAPPGAADTVTVADSGPVAVPMPTPHSAATAADSPARCPSPSLSPCRCRHRAVPPPPRRAPPRPLRRCHRAGAPILDAAWTGTAPASAPPPHRADARAARHRFASDNRTRAAICLHCMRDLGLSVLTFWGKEEDLGAVRQ